MDKKVCCHLLMHCRLSILVAVVTGLGVNVLSGCSNGDARNSDSAGKDEGDKIPKSNEKDVAGCGECEDFEVCLDNKCLCEPSCDGKTIKDDGCGGQCACADGTVANEHLRCVEPDECSGSCELAGWECGEICGESCGDCDPNHRCESGYCECEPICDGTRCDDGCGGICSCASGTVCNLDKDCVSPEECNDTCEETEYSCGSLCGKTCGVCGETESCIDHACEVAVNCENCSLRLSLVNKKISSDRLKEINLAIDYEPSEAEPKPRMFDIRLKVDNGVSLAALTVGEALLNAGKDLYSDPDTQKKWQERADGTYRFVAFSVIDNSEIEKGRLMTLRFGVDTDRAAVFSIVKKAQIFAPPLADQALQTSRYGETIQVTQ